MIRFRGVLIDVGLEVVEGRSFCFLHGWASPSWQKQLREMVAKRLEEDDLLFQGKIRRREKWSSDLPSDMGYGRYLIDLIFIHSFIHVFN